MIPISARDGDGVAEHTARISWYRGPTVVEAIDALEPARPLELLALRLPVQAIYKFDDRRIVAGRIESGHLNAGDEIVIMPVRQDRKDQVHRELAGDAAHWHPRRRSLGRHYARP